MDATGRKHRLKWVAHEIYPSESKNLGLITTHMRYGHSETWPTLWRRRVHTISLESVDLTLAGSGLWERRRLSKMHIGPAA